MLQTTTLMLRLMMVVVKPTALIHSGIVAMANVSPQAMFVMAQVNSVMPDGDLTVLMAQMKV